MLLGLVSRALRSNQEIVESPHVKSVGRAREKGSNQEIVERSFTTTLLPPSYKTRSNQEIVESSSRIVLASSLFFNRSNQEIVERSNLKHHGCEFTLLKQSRDSRKFRILSSSFRKGSTKQSRDSRKSRSSRKVAVATTAEAIKR